MHVFTAMPLPRPGSWAGPAHHWLHVAIFLTPPPDCGPWVGDSQIKYSIQEKGINPEQHVYNTQSTPSAPRKAGKGEKGTAGGNWQPRGDFYWGWAVCLQQSLYLSLEYSTYSHTLRLAKIKEKHHQHLVWTLQKYFQGQVGGRVFPGGPNQATQEKESSRTSGAQWKLLLAPNSCFDFMTQSMKETLHLALTKSYCLTVRDKAMPILKIGKASLSCFNFLVKWRNYRKAKGTQHSMAGRWILFILQFLVTLKG